MIRRSHVWRATSLLCTLLLLSPVCLVAQTQPKGQAQRKAEEVAVYVTKTGTKYHLESCRHLARSKIAASLKDAKAKGYTPCKVCKPPE